MDERVVDVYIDGLFDMFPDELNGCTKDGAKRDLWAPSIAKDYDTIQWIAYVMECSVNEVLDVLKRGYEYRSKPGRIARPSLRERIRERVSR